MNMLLLFHDDFINAGRVRITGRRLRHLVEVHRVAAGDELNAGLAGGLMGTARVTHIAADAAEMDVELFRSPPPALPLLLILALPRPKMLRRVLFSASSLGVKKILLINSYRVEKSYWQSPLLSEEDIRHQLILGLEQAKDTTMPEVVLRPFFKPFAEDELPGHIAGSSAFVAHPPATEACPQAVSGHITLAIGPEGGFIPYEIERLIECGFRPVSLGGRILRVETAVPYLISRLSP